MSNKNIINVAMDMANKPPPPPPKYSPSPIGKSSAESGNSTCSNFTTKTDTTATTGAHHPSSTGPPINSQSSPVLSPPLLLVEIEEGTPAAEALRANADVRVSKVRKVARSTKLQAGVRVLKSAARTASGQPGHAGDRRGAPAFVSPRDLAAAEESSNTVGAPPPTIPEVDDEGDSDAGSRKKAGILYSPKIAAAAIRDLGDSIASDNLHMLDDSVKSVSDGGGAAMAPVAPATKQQQQQQQQPSYLVHSLLLASSTNNNQITHAALPAAVAAACRAGEEMDRRRIITITTPGRSGSADHHHRRATTGIGGRERPTPSTPPRWSTKNLFKPSKAFSSPAFDENRDNVSDTFAIPKQSLDAVAESQQKTSSSSDAIDGPQPLARPGNVFRGRSAPEYRGMPSEISVADTVKHANLTSDHLHDLEDLSDDEIITAEIYGDKKSSVIKEDEDVVLKKAPVSPIIIKLPDQFTEDDSKTQKERQGEEDNMCRQADMAVSKKKSKRSKRFKLSKDEDEAFHFNGPNSVRRFIKKRRSKESSDERRSYVKGKVIDGKHELYTMSIAVMLGMRTSIGRTNLEMSETTHNERRWLDNDDLMAVVKYVFPPRGGVITPPHQLNHTFKFKDYSPLAFAYLRRMFGVNEYDFLLSVCGNANYIEFQSNAKSGQFFFYSKDGKYMIKTMTNAESKFLRRILPHYFRHCSLNPNTLVTKFLGMYRVKLYHLRRNVKFVVMKSVYDTDKHLDQLFDVKGSSKGRDARPGEAVKKDNDVRRALPDGAFVLDPDLRCKLRMQVKKDCEWLKSMKIMDYSMLIGVHNIRHSDGRSQKQLRPSIRGRSFKSATDQDSQQLLQSIRNDDADETSYSSIDASLVMLEQYLEDNEDDDDSYLKGSISRVCKQGKKRDTSSATDDGSLTVRLNRSVDNEDESTKNDKLKAEEIVEQAIQDMYWPFHRYYDIQGRRRINPIRSSLVTDNRKKVGQIRQSEPSPTGPFSFLTSINESNVDSVLENGGKVELPTFETPLSFRKDGGFIMDLTGMEQPLKLNVPGAPETVEYCDGKIFYMGIIDILQQFNIRKRLEAKFRRIGTKGWEAASCVHPNIYADRFVRFYDEYTEGINLRENEYETRDDGYTSTSGKDDENDEINDPEASEKIKHKSE